MSRPLPRWPARGRGVKWRQAERDADRDRSSSVAGLRPSNSAAPQGRAAALLAAGDSLPPASFGRKDGMARWAPVPSTGTHRLPAERRRHPAWAPRLDLPAAQRRPESIRRCPPPLATPPHRPAAQAELRASSRPPSWSGPDRHPARPGAISTLGLGAGQRGRGLLIGAVQPASPSSSRATDASSAAKLLFGGGSAALLC